MIGSVLTSAKGRESIFIDVAATWLVRRKKDRVSAIGQEAGVVVPVVPLVVIVIIMIVAVKVLVQTVLAVVYLGFDASASIRLKREAVSVCVRES